MTMQDASVISEFSTGRRDLCMESSEAMALHCVDPAKYPLTPETLNAIFLRHAKRLTDAGRPVSGNETLAEVDADLAGLSVPHTTYAYREPFPQDGDGGWHTLLTTFAGYAGIILQVANGAAFGYQSSLRYHGVFVYKHASGAPDWSYLVGDPANPLAAQGKFATYSLAQIIAAQPCGVIVVPAPLAPPPPPKPSPAIDFAAVVGRLQAARTILDQLLAQLAPLAGS